MIPCTSCGCFHKAESACPHCDGGGIGLTGTALLLGLSLAACGDKDQYDDSNVVAEYGVAMTDYDQDGYYAESDDCDDDDAAIHPGATETADDGVDSNCDGEDNT